MRAGAPERVISRRVQTGRWDRVHPNVFRIAGAEMTWRQRLVAARLAWGEDDAVVSHRSTAAILRLPGFEPGILEVTVPPGRRRSGVDHVIVHRVPLSPLDVTEVEGIPMTTPARTLIDLASVVRPDLLEEALDDALRRKLVTMPRMRWRLAEIGRQGRPGIAAIRELLDARGPAATVPASVFETRLRRVLREAGLPEPVLQHEVRDRGRLVAVIDFAYVRERVAIEAEGYRWHGVRVRWASDLARRNALTALGWRILHVTWDDIVSGREQLIARVKALLASGASSVR